MVLRNAGILPHHLHGFTTQKTTISKSDYSTNQFTGMFLFGYQRWYINLQESFKEFTSLFSLYHFSEFYYSCLLNCRTTAYRIAFSTLVEGNDNFYFATDFLQNHHFFGIT